MYLEPLHKDPGLQPERTTLSWTRTTISLAVCTAVLLRWTNFYGAAILIPVVILVALAMFILVTQRIRYTRQSLGIVSERVPPNLVGVGALTLTMLAFGATGIFFVTAH
ncbi:DUF202 domain-containing protein [Corynebacterium gallinarum]|uniref:DUF202 domain-containing protein n=1 Tax=Corynebacterium gallinarum TaxID=2762214 RepID=A0A8I0LAK8_9CORY|nr:DUF202 domain-containing protein [Corynebacterium gallinarum]MBD8029852.1 DUF202 domain-containing protein [Corynebacterium gallinarum]